MKTFVNCIENKYIPFIYHTNAPQVEILNILDSTEKAVLVQHEQTNKKVWLPISGFTATKYGAYTIKNWLKKKLNKYQQKALYLLI